MTLERLHHGPHRGLVAAIVAMLVDDEDMFLSHALPVFCVSPGGMFVPDGFRIPPPESTTLLSRPVLFSRGHKAGNSGAVSGCRRWRRGSERGRSRKRCRGLRRTLSCQRKPNLSRAGRLPSVRKYQALSFSILQDEPLDHPPCGDALRPIPALAQESRRPAARTWRRCQSQDDPVLVAQARPGVCCRDPETPDRRDEVQPLAMAPQRDVREVQW